MVTFEKAINKFVALCIEQLKMFEIFLMVAFQQLIAIGTYKDLHQCPICCQTYKDYNKPYIGDKSV
jgi:hypothetical protein